MADKHNVIKGIDMCLSEKSCNNMECPYKQEGFEKCIDSLKTDALELLKEEQWIPVGKRLPDPNIEVLVSCYETNFKGEREYRTTVAVYIPRFTVLSCEKFDGSCDIESVEEYNEENDEYYVREGWYEETYDGTTFEGKSFVLYGEVVAWKPKPQPWKDGEQE